MMQTFNTLLRPTRLGIRGILRCSKNGLVLHHPKYVVDSLINRNYGKPITGVSSGISNSIYRNFRAFHTISYIDNISSIKVIGSLPTKLATYGTTSPPVFTTLLSSKEGVKHIYFRRYLSNFLSRRTVTSEKSTVFTRGEVMRLLQLNSFTEDEIRSSYVRLYGIYISNTKDNPLKAITGDVSANAGIDTANENSAMPRMSPDAVTESLLVIARQSNLVQSPSHQSEDIALQEKVNNLVDVLCGLKNLSPSKLNIESNQADFMLSYSVYNSSIRLLAEQLDNRLWPIAISFLWTGLSIGIVIPFMPILVKILDIPAGEYGFIIGIFGLSKLLGNIPASYLVDKYGRKPAMVVGLSLCAVGVGGIGLSLFPGFGTPWLFFCRILTGFGVSAFVGGSYMYISDISTVLNRTRTLAPANAAFQAGSALGPAIGGLFAHSVGLGATYGIVGISFASLAFLNYFLLPETLEKIKDNSRPSETKFISDSKENATNGLSTTNVSTVPEVKSDGKDDILTICRDTLKIWWQLLQHNNIRDIVALNCAYWMTISGAQMTLLPLYMIGPVLQLEPSSIGLSFAAMSVISVLSSYKIASFADNIGKIEMTAVGALFVAASVMCIPYASSFTELLCILCPLALGSTAITAIPQAYITDLTLPHQRANAMALLRAGGDIGQLLGAIVTGLIAQHTSMFAAIEMNGSIMLLAILVFGYRSRQLFQQHLTKAVDTKTSKKKDA